MRTPLLLLAACALAPAASSQWINEIHYDNIGGDVNEFVEIALPSSASISDYEVELYNGSGGALYGTFDSADFIQGATVNGITFYAASGPANSIQNGNPDGLALINTAAGQVVPGQFLSYEGTFAATSGVAGGAGLTSTDIGVAESNATTGTTESLQLTGSGSAYSDFSWAAPSGATPGSTNNGQTIAGGGGGMMPTLTVQPTAAAANEGDTTRVPVTLTTADGNPTTNAIAFTVTQIGGDATNADYAPYTEFGQTFDGNLPATFFIPPGVASGETILLPIPLEDDMLVEDVETAVVQLSSDQATFTNDTFTLTINDNDDTPFSANIDYGTCPEPPAMLPAGRNRCRVQVGGTSNVDVAQRFTVFLRIDGAGGFSRIAFRGEIKPAAQETISPISLPLNTRGSDPSGPLTVTVVVERGSVSAPGPDARDLDTITLLKASGGPAVMTPTSAVK